MRSKRNASRNHSAPGGVCVFAVTLAIAVVWSPSHLSGSDCSVTSVGMEPINDLGAGLYLGQFVGGLYPDGANVPPATHHNEGIARAAGIVPLDSDGNPDANGKYVLLSIGMSNTTQEFCSQDSGLPCDAWTFMGQAGDSSAVDHTRLAIVNGAFGGQAASAWESPAAPNYDRVRDTKLIPQNLTEAQVVAVWLKNANPNPGVSLPDGGADALDLLGRLGNGIRAMKVRYPNLRIVFLSSRIYAGYASSTLNPEPYAYESAFSVKWLIEAQIDQVGGGGIQPNAGDLDYSLGAPWLAWGPYLWADGLIPRSDGLIWTCDDMQSDGTHPAQSAEEKVGTQLLQFMLNSPYSGPWFGSGANSAGDCTGDGAVNLADFATFSVCFGLTGPGGSCGPQRFACSDLDDNGSVNLVDFATFALVFSE